MIFIGIGANLPTERHGSPLGACVAALGALQGRGATHISARSRWYASAPVPASDQPWYVNGVVRVETALEPEALLDRLHGIEAEFGRVRAHPNAARVLDLDLLDYDGRVTGPEARVRLPHPRLHERAFVLLPLREIAPAWRHPVLGHRLDDLIASLPDPDAARPIDPGITE